MRIVNFRHSWTILSIMKVCRERKSKNEYTTISKQFTPHRATAILFFFFFSIFFFYLKFFLFFFFFGDNHSPTLNNWTKRRERNSDKNDRVLIFFLFSSLNGIWFLAMQFHVGSCFFRLDVNTTLRAFTDCNRNFFSQVESCFTVMFTMWWIIEDNWKKLIGNARFCYRFFENFWK